ncbi:hypothetical protein Efla_007369 [Eimeria flavescens]
MEDHLSIARSPLQRFEQRQQQRQQQQKQHQQSRRRALERASVSEPQSSLHRSSSDKCLYRTQSTVGLPARISERLWQHEYQPSPAAAAATAAADGDSVALRMASSPLSGNSSPRKQLSGPQVSPEVSSELLGCPFPGGDGSSVAVSLQQPLLSLRGCVSPNCEELLSPAASLSASNTASRLAAVRGGGAPAWGLRERMRACAHWLVGGRSSSSTQEDEASAVFGWGILRERAGGFPPATSSSLPSRSFAADRALSDRPPVRRQSSLSILASLPQRPRKFAVVEISGGSCHRRDMQTPELLRIVHLHNKHQELLDTKVGALKLRDLRQVVSPSGDGRPSIEVRRNCVLVNMPTIRCILLYNKILLLPPNRLSPLAEAAARGHRSTRSIQLSDAGLVEEDVGGMESVNQQYEMLISKLLHLSDLKRSGPPEFAALEALLVHVCDSLIAELAPLKAAADRLLHYFHEQPSSTRRLRQISDLKRRLNSSKEKACGVERAIRELLNEEEDMLRLEVSRFWGHDELWDSPTKTAQAEDAEILLECYEQEVIVRTEDGLDDALQLMELHLASTRNAFLKMEIALDILSAFFGFVAAAAGIFGMNIRSGWEDKTTIFWSVLNGASVASLVVFISVYFWFKRQKL